jgi:hypothetical protein
MPPAYPTGVGRADSGRSKERRALDHPRPDAHATTRARVAKVLGQEETYFSPRLLSTAQSRSATQSELVQFWPSRIAVPGRCLAIPCGVL